MYAQIHKLCTFACVANIYIYTTIQTFWTGNICLFWKKWRLSKNPEKHWFPQQYEAAQLFSTQIIIRNISWVQNQHFTKISEGSCDPKDWSNGSRKFNSYHRNKLCLKIYPNRYFSILQNIFDQVNTTLVSIRDFFQNLTNLKLLNSNVKQSHPVMITK